MQAPVEIWTSLDPEWDRDGVLKHMYNLSKWLYECADNCDVSYLHIGGNFGSTKECFVGFEGVTSDGVTYYAYLCWDRLLPGKTVYFEVVPVPGFTPLQMFQKIKGMVTIKSYPRAILIMWDELEGQIVDIAHSVRESADSSDSSVLSSVPVDLIIHGFRRVILYSVFRDAKDGIMRETAEFGADDMDAYHAFVLLLVRSLSMRDVSFSGGLGHPVCVSLPMTIRAGVEILFSMGKTYLCHSLVDASDDRIAELYPLVVHKLMEGLKKTGPYECSLIGEYYHPWRLWSDVEKKLFEKLSI